MAFYHPLHGAVLHLYMPNRYRGTYRGSADPVVGVLKKAPKTDDGSFAATALQGAVTVTIDDYGVTRCYYNGQITEHYSIIYPGKRSRKRFSRY